MPFHRFSSLRAAAAVLALAGAGAAQAGDVHWSIGVQAAPGVTIGVGNSRPVVVAQAPVVVYPAPVVTHRPPVVYAPAPVYVRPAPVYVRPAPVVYGPPVVYGQPRHRPHGHAHGWRHGPKDRYDRDDRRR